MPAGTLDKLDTGKGAKDLSCKGMRRDCSFSQQRVRVLEMLTHAPSAPSTFGCTSSHAQGQLLAIPVIKNILQRLNRLES